MALSGLYSNFNLLLRWLHVLAGIIWLGHLYFFNFVNVPLQDSLDEAGRKAVNPDLMPLVLGWYRWGAMLTLLSGLLLFGMNYAYTPGAGFGPTPLLADANGITSRAAWIMFGMSLAAVMWFNVWFVGWPAQKKEMRGRASGAELTLLRRRSFRAFRTNAYLSGPMLFGMLAPAHYGAMNWVTFLSALAIGLLAIWCAIRVSSAPRATR